MKKSLSLLLGFVLGFGLIALSYAYDTDRDQPATLDADEFDMVFQPGVRPYRGNVVYQLGSIRLFADELVAYFKDGELQRAVARGNLAEFRQRPDDSETDVVGVALRIELNEVKQTVILRDRARVTQDANTVTGKRIVYNMLTEKVNVRSGKEKQTKPKVPSTTDGGTETPAAAEEDTARPRIVIQPRN
ncbi:MAG: lipopolysaccharide transport periplasmic protein LptA [Desulfobacterales bacterium]|nr:lipopolysaccharide transport periplasmic protein LptA [Desulfobacterales bacterium]